MNRSSASRNDAVRKTAETYPRTLSENMNADIMTYMTIIAGASLRSPEDTDEKTATAQIAIQCESGTSLHLRSRYDADSSTITVISNDNGHAYMVLGLSNRVL